MGPTVWVGLTRRCPVNIVVMPQCREHARQTIPSGGRGHPHFALVRFGRTWQSFPCNRFSGVQFRAEAVGGGEKVMARSPRRDLVDATEVGVYHCVQRAVRRAWFCGQDPVTGKNFDHRKGWIQERLAFLAGQFSIDICAMAIMSNHIHMVVRNQPDIAGQWSDENVPALGSGLQNSSFAATAFSIWLDDWPRKLNSVRLTPRPTRVISQS